MSSPHSEEHSDLDQEGTMAGTSMRGASASIISVLAIFMPGEVA